MAIIDWLMRFIFFIWLGAFGVGLADFAVRIQSETIKAYQKGPVSASKFTRMMTGEK